MANEYIIPLGIDGKSLLGDLDKTISSLEQVENKAIEAGKVINDGFKKGSDAASNMDSSLKSTIKNLESVAEAGRLVGKRLTESMKANNLKGISDEISKIRDKFDSLSKGIKFDIDDAKLKIFEKEVLNAKTEMEQLNVVLNFTKNLLNDLDPNSPEFLALSEAVTFATSALDEFDKSVVVNVEQSKSLKTELREIKAELQQMEMNGEEGSKRFFEMSIRAAELEDQIGDTSQQIKILASDTKNIDALLSGVKGLVGAFTLAQGAVALFGTENEELNRALLKVNAAMAVLQGLQAVADTLNKDSAFSVVFLRNSRLQEAAATELETVSTVANTTALATNTVATEAQAGATVTATAATQGATVASRAFGLALKGLGIGLIIGAIAFLVEKWDDLKAGLDKILPVGFSVGKMFDQIKSIAMGVGTAVLNYLVMPFKAITSLLTGDFEGFKQAIVDGLSFKKNFTDGYNKQELANEKAHQKELEEERIKADERDLQRRKNRGENVEKEEIELQKRRLAIQDADSKAYKENLEKLEDLQDKHYKTQSDAAKKAADDAKKKRDEDNKKALEDAKKQNDLLISFTKQLTDIRIASIEDEGEREREKIKEDYQRRIDEVMRQEATTTEAIIAQRDLIIALGEERNAKIIKSDEDLKKQRIATQLEANKEILLLSEQNQENELKMLDLEYKDKKAKIEEQYKNEGDLKKQLLTALDARTAKERKAIADYYANEALKDEEERQLLTIDLASQYAKETEKTERQKQIAILETKVEFAEKSLNLLLESGEDENSLQVLRAKKLVNDLKKELGSISNDGNTKFDLFEFLGVDLGEYEDEVKEAGKIIGQSLGQITDFIVDQYQRQIDKKQEVIDQLDNEIGDLEDRLDEEKSLHEQGYANNVEIIQAELAAKQQEKDEEVRQQEELMKKQQDLQKAQFAVDTAMQLVNMITASTNIFKSLSSIPFIGIPLAITTIATMFGAFAAAKIKAAQSITAVQFGEGGWIDGKSHAQGGKKYYSPDGEVRELERDEFVVRRKQALKFGNLLEAINNDRFTGFDVNDREFVSMLNDMGISLPDTNDVVKDANRLAAIFNIDGGFGNSDFREMNENIKFLAQQEREKTTTWEDDKYFYIKKGMKTTRIKKEATNAD